MEFLFYILQLKLVRNDCKLQLDKNHFVIMKLSKTVSYERKAGGGAGLVYSKVTSKLVSRIKTDSRQKKQK